MRPLISLSLVPVALIALSSVLAGCAAEAAPIGAAEAVSAPAETPAPAVKLDLGTVDADAVVEIDVPEGTTGFTIVVQGEAQSSDFLGVKELTDPSGNVVIRDFLQTSGEGRSQTGDGGSGIGVVRVPFVGDHAGDRVVPGKWTARLGGERGSAKGAKGAQTPWSGRLQGVVFLQTSADGAFHGGALDLDFYVPDGLRISGDGGSHAIDADSAATDPRLSQMIDTAYGFAHRLWGIDRGEVRFHRIAASVASIRDQRAVDAANRLATYTGERPSGQIVLTNRLSPDGDDTVISGVSNCLPGAIGVPGTKCSAVILSVRDSMEVWMDASTLIHELGHFIGLEHTTELGGLGDSLSDTPVCRNTEEKSALWSCPDVNNIMFPTVNLASSEASVWASEKQKALWRTSPLFRATR